jgi:hypothetical protein
LAEREDRTTEEDDDEDVVIEENDDDDDDDGDYENGEGNHEDDEDDDDDDEEDGDSDDDDDDNDDDDNDNDNDNDRGHHQGNRRWDRSWQSFNFDLGTNNFLADNKFPTDNDPYAVRPWGSWYIGANSIQRSRLAKKFFLEWGLGMSWYSFKFENDNTRITKDDTGIQFTQDLSDVNFKKSKLSISYVQASLIPVLDFGDHGRKRRVWDDYNNKSFRIGLGPYIAYRISSHSKVVYEDGGDRERDKDRDSFYLNNFRYGARLQVGFRSTDLFFNYDLNELFVENKGPKVNAFSFGVIF